MKPEVKKIMVDLLRNNSELYEYSNKIEEAFIVLKECIKNGNKIMVCGNGGSASDSEHIVGELMKGFKLPRKLKSFELKLLEDAFPKDGEFLYDNLQGAIPAISLVNSCALISAFNNDVSPEMCFAQQVYGYGRKGDVLIGLSTSGNSTNVIYALKTAKAFGLKTIGMTGISGGMMEAICDVVINTPSSDTYRIQEYHLPIYHALCAMLEEEIFGSK
jgi:phosphoheptose isomerase